MHFTLKWITYLFGQWTCFKLNSNGSCAIFGVYFVSVCVYVYVCMLVCAKIAKAIAKFNWTFYFKLSLFLIDIWNSKYSESVETLFDKDMTKCTSGVLIAFLLITTIAANGKRMILKLEIINEWFFSESNKRFELFKCECKKATKKHHNNSQLQNFASDVKKKKQKNSTSWKKN